MSSVVSLLNQIKNDEIVLPAIRRDFVWSEEKIVRLLDAMVRGYPIGPVLLWESYSDIRIGALSRIISLKTSITSGRTSRTKG